MFLTRFSNFLVEVVVVLVAVAEAVTDTTIVPPVAEAVNVLAPMIVPPVVLSEISLLFSRGLFCFDFSMRLPRCCCFGYEKEKETEGKWMALFRDLFF